MGNIFGIFDAARDDKIYHLIQATGEHRCLLAGSLAPEVVEAAPYIVRFIPNEPLWPAWLSTGRGHSWGIMLQSPYGLNDVCRHFRRFLQAMLPDGEVVMFRFYDPRVWRTFIPTCNVAELERWFSNIDEFRCEDRDGQATISYRFVGGHLIHQRLSRS